MLWYHIFIVFGACLGVTCAEIWLEYPIKKTILICKSIHFVHLSIFNLIVAGALLVLNMELKIIQSTSPIFFAFFIGSSGYLLLNSKISLENSTGLSGFKSFASQKKTKLYNDLNKYISEEYPLNLAQSIADKFIYNKKNIGGYISYIYAMNRVMARGNNEKEKKYKEEIDDILSIDGLDAEHKVFLLTNKLFEIDETYWVKGNVLRKYCNGRGI